MLRPRHSSQSISFSAYTFSCLQSPVFQSLRSDSLSTCAVCNVQHSSVLSVKRTRTYIIPSSKTCSAQSTILPWTPGYCLAGLGKSLVGFSAAFLFFIGWPLLRTLEQRQPASAFYSRRDSTCPASSHPLFSVPPVSSSWPALRRSAPHRTHPIRGESPGAAANPSSCAVPRSPECRNKCRPGLWFSACTRAGICRPTRHPPRPSRRSCRRIPDSHRHGQSLLRRGHLESVPY